jgi:hypothetical protein
VNYRLVELAILPGVHTENSLVIEGVTVIGNAKFPDGTGFGFEFLSLEFTFKGNFFTKLVRENTLLK